MKRVDSAVASIFIFSLLACSEDVVGVEAEAPDEPGGKTDDGAERESVDGVEEQLVTYLEANFDPAVTLEGAARMLAGSADSESTELARLVGALEATYTTPEMGSSDAAFEERYSQGSWRTLFTNSPFELGFDVSPTGEPIERTPEQLDRLRRTLLYQHVRGETLFFARFAPENGGRVTLLRATWAPVFVGDSDLLHWGFEFSAGNERAAGAFPGMNLQTFFDPFVTGILNPLPPVDTEGADRPAFSNFRSAFYRTTYVSSDVRIIRGGVLYENPFGIEPGTTPFIWILKHATFLPSPIFAPSELSDGGVGVGELSDGGVGFDLDAGVGMDFDAGVEDDGGFGQSDASSGS